MKIQVTQECIREGKQCHASFCPVALALKNAGFFLVIVRKDLMNIDFKKINVPDTISNFIINFDKGYNVMPFEFELDEEKGEITDIN